ncbi:MAG: hypothetical protein GWN47_05100 [Woeseiaceae bacterium]|nr:hypothetical protein [Woeseiaceae bacterium]
MNMTLVILLLLLLIALWVLLRLRKSAGGETAPPKAATSAPGAAYHAVSIKMSGNACQAAKDRSGRRFLSTAAPRLPLPDCDAMECNCRFVHHKDRRSGKDRRSPFGPSGFGGGTGNYEVEQREGGDRRRREDDDYF